MDRGEGGILGSAQMCTKSGRPILEVLHTPPLRDPQSMGDRGETFKPYAYTPEPVPVACTHEVVEQAAGRLSGATGGVDWIGQRVPNELVLPVWCGVWGGLCNEIALWVEWLANTHPPWAVY